MDTKLTLTIYDIVTHLIPGAAVLLSLYFFTGLGRDLPDSILIFSLIVFGYLTGALLHLLGLILFWPFYLEDYSAGTVSHRLVKATEKFISKFPLLRVSRVDQSIKAELSSLIKSKLGVDLSESRLGLFSVADTFVSSLGFQERDALLAKEGFFRSLTVLAVLGTVYFFLTSYVQNKALVLIVGLLLTELFRFGREHNRVIKNQQVYTLALIKLKQ